MLVIRTVSSRRFRLTDRLPSPRGEDFHRRLAGRRFQPLTASETCTYGWVDADNLLTTELDADSVLRGEHAVFGLRVDRRRVNPRLRRARIDLELRARRQAARDGGRPGRVSREERSQVRTDVEAELLAVTNPSVQACTILVHPRRRVVQVLTLSRPVVEIAVRLFRETFAVDLLPLTPWTRSEEILAGSPGRDALDALDRTDFATPEARAPAEAPADVSTPGATGSPGTGASRVSDALVPEALIPDALDVPDVPGEFVREVGEEAQR